MHVNAMTAHGPHAVSYSFTQHPLPMTHPHSISPGLQGIRNTPNPTQTELMPNPRARQLSAVSVSNFLRPWLGIGSYQLGET